MLLALSPFSAFVFSESPNMRSTNIVVGASMLSQFTAGLSEIGSWEPEHCSQRILQEEPEEGRPGLAALIPMRTD